MEKLKIIIDTNVWIKGILFKDKNPYSSKVINLAKNRKLNLIFSQETIGELMYMLKEACSWKNKNKNDSLEILKQASLNFYYGTSVNTLETKAFHCNDENDDMFLKCAIEGQADYIISEDYASGMQSIEEIKAVDSKQFIDIYYDLIKNQEVAVDIDVDNIIDNIVDVNNIEKDGQVK